MPRTIQVVVEPDVRLDSIRTEARTSFRGVAAEADKASDDIERAFRGVDNDIRQSFTGLEASVAGEFSGIGTAAEREFDDIETSSDRAAAGIGTAFAGVGDDVIRAFAGLDARISREFDDIEDDARDSFDGIEQAASRSADGIGGEFAGVESDVARALSGVGDRASRELSDIPPPNLDSAIVRPFAEAGEDAGGSLADGIASGVDGIDFSSLGGNLAGGLAGLGSPGGPVFAAGAAIGVVFGDEIAAGFDRSFNSRRTDILFTISNGLSPADLAPIGRAAGEAYSDGLGEGLSDVRQTAALLQNELGGIDDSFDLSGVTRQAQALEQVFGVELAQSIEVARRLVANDLVNDSTEAFNLIGQVAQRYRLDFEDILEVASEFSPVFGKLGVDGAQAFDIIGQSVQEGLLPNVDRAAELFEEFNIRLGETDTLRGPVQALGLDFEEMQQKLANGQGDEVLADIAEALIAIEDPARRDAAAVEFFGAAIESASNPERVLELLATADAIGEVGTAADDAAEAVASTQSSFDILKRVAEDAGSALGTFADAALLGQLGERTTSLARFADGFEFVAQKAGLDGAAGALNEFGAATDQIEGLVGSALSAEALAAALEEVNEAVGTAEFGSFTGDVSELEDGLIATAEAVDNLGVALDEFAGRFDEDSIMRSIAEDTDRALAAVEGLTAGTFDLTAGFDINTEAGRRAEASLEGLSGNLDDLIAGYQDGTIQAPEFASGQARIEAGVRAVAAQMGLTQAQTDALVAKYATVPDEIATDVYINDLSKQSIASIISDINRIPRNVFVNVRTGRSGNFTGFADPFADGGITATGRGFGGELGPELVQLDSPGRRYTAADLDRGGLPGRWSVIGTDGPGHFDVGEQARIYSTAESRRLIAEARARLPHLAGGGVAREEALAIIGDNPNARIDPEIVAPQSFIEEALRKVLAEAGNNAGGPKIQIGQVVLDEGADLWEQLALTEQLYAA